MNRDEIRQHNRSCMPSLAAELDGTLGDLMREFNASLQYAVSDGHEVGTQTEPYDVPLGYTRCTGTYYDLRDFADLRKQGVPV